MSGGELFVSTPLYKLISATPSPYARKVRIALAEKAIPFELVTEVPWDSTTTTPAYNPLEKVPILIPEDGSLPVYESHFIMEYLEVKHPEPPLMPAEPDGRLMARRLEVLCDGICDALVLMFFERMRQEEQQSREWLARQRRKVDGGLAEIARLIGDREFAVGDRFSLGDIAAATVVGYISVRWPDMPWRKNHPNLAAHADRMEQRSSLANTRPVAQKISDKVV
jgi:glutathione S-transferase